MGQEHGYERPFILNIYESVKRESDNRMHRDLIAIQTATNEDTYIPIPYSLERLPVRKEVSKKAR